jgi:uncharacterized protein (TIGR02271 family)
LSDPDQPDPQIIPLVQEELHVERRLVETDHVRVRTVVEETPILRTEDLDRGEIDIERVATERPVETVPAPYMDGDTLVVPVVEERLVVEKRLFVVEELRIRQRTVTETVSVTDTLRRTRAVIEREPTPTGEPND